MFPNRDDGRDRYIDPLTHSGRRGSLSERDEVRNGRVSDAELGDNNEAGGSVDVDGSHHGIDCECFSSLQYSQVSARSNEGAGGEVSNPSRGIVGEEASVGGGGRGGTGLQVPTSEMSNGHR
ncbi:hypothetical protein Pmani_033445 [Petrolisthes manimaculis]|uniref:Uncharacterized protein n=1 Tax=Petrolisthes manimaculis TaxID=1843537 RepID=A0AAE1TQE3_9EUCA|nr:hypothetical protein Pmani_033445 [Petrolisthes manimaculis]